MALTCSCQLSPEGSILCWRVAPFSPTAMRNSYTKQHKALQLSPTSPSNSKLDIFLKKKKMCCLLCTHFS